MADYWIVTSRKYHRHVHERGAYAERNRLRALHPEKDFRVVRCKTHPQRGTTIASVMQFLERMAAMTQPGVDAEDDASTLISLKLQAQLLLNQMSAPANDAAAVEEGAGVATTAEAAHG